MRRKLSCTHLLPGQRLFVDLLVDAGVAIFVVLLALDVADTV